MRPTLPLLARLGCASEEERDKTDAIKAMKLTRNSSLAARESAVTLLTVLESPVRILLILNEIVNPINSKSAVGLMTVLLILIFLPSSRLEIGCTKGNPPYSPKEEGPHAMVPCERRDTP